MPVQSPDLATYMQSLDHPLKPEIEQLREILKSADERLSERIKWNAPSYHLDGVDIVTFGPLMRKKDEILLVFHHPKVVEIVSDILEGQFKDRRLVTLRNQAEVDANAEELQRIVRGILALIP
ncbi:MAG TPA: DUF1801 domain-containing protein [Saprospiraceae bacterium]|nr:DUF1801 domain-containing protein [Saprospiraceae bacterium]